MNRLLVLAKWVKAKLYYGVIQLRNTYGHSLR